MGNLKNKLLLEKHTVLLGRILRAANKETGLSFLACQLQIPFKKTRKRKRKANVPQLKPRRDKICLVCFKWWLQLRLLSSDHVICLFVKCSSGSLKEIPEAKKNPSCLSGELCLLMPSIVE